MNGIDWESEFILISYWKNIVACHSPSYLQEATFLPSIQDGDAYWQIGLSCF
jgi:hypothetical protein